MTSVSSPLSTSLEKPFLMSQKRLSPYKVSWQLNRAALLGAGRVTPLHTQLVLCFLLELKFSRQLETSLSLFLPSSPGNIHTCLFLTKNLLSGNLNHPWFPKTKTKVFLCWLHSVFIDYLYREMVGSPFLYLSGKKRWSTRRSCLVRSCGPEMSGGNGVWEGSDGTWNQARTIQPFRNRTQYPPH